MFITLLVVGGAGWRRHYGCRLPHTGTPECPLSAGWALPAPSKRPCLYGRRFPPAGVGAPLYDGLTSPVPGFEFPSTSKSFKSLQYYEHSQPTSYPHSSARPEMCPCPQSISCAWIHVSSHAALLVENPMTLFGRSFVPEPNFSLQRIQSPFDTVGANPDFFSNQLARDFGIHFYAG